MLVKLDNLRPLRAPEIRRSAKPLLLAAGLRCRHPQSPQWAHLFAVIAVCLNNPEPPTCNLTRHLFEKVTGGGPHHSASNEVMCALFLPMRKGHTASC